MVKITKYIIYSLFIVYILLSKASSIESAAHKVEVAKCFGILMTIKNNSLDGMLENQNMQGLILFAQISRLGSISAAAQLLGLSRSAVSKQLSGLEKKIGARLLNRTTRKIID